MFFVNTFIDCSYFSVVFLALFSSFLVVFNKNPVYSILFLILTFLNCSLLLFIIGIEFLAIIFIIVYVGAVAVLFLFVLMMLDLRLDNIGSRIRNSYYPILLFFFYFVFFEFFQALYLKFFFSYSSRYNLVKVENIDFSYLLNNYSDIYLLGSVLYSYTFVLFFGSSLILFISMIVSIFLTHEHMFSEHKKKNSIRFLKLNPLSLVKKNKI